MKKEKIPFYEKYNPIELYIWRNQKHFGNLLNHLHAKPYGSRNSKWRYDFETKEFVWNQFDQIEKHSWSKTPKVKRMLAQKLLGGLRNEFSPMWLEFQKSLIEFEKQKKGEI